MRRPFSWRAWVLHCCVSWWSLNQARRSSFPCSTMKQSYSGGVISKQDWYDGYIVYESFLPGKVLVIYFMLYRLNWPAEYHFNSNSVLMYEFSLPLLALVTQEVRTSLTSKYGFLLNFLVSRCGGGDHSAGRGRKADNKGLSVGRFRFYPK